MKPVVIIAIAVGVSVVAVLGVLIGIGAYQQAQLEKEQREANQAFINLMQKVAESEQEQSTTPQPAKSTPPLLLQDCSGSAGCIVGYVTDVIDGDTIEVDGTRIRLALTSTPELSEEYGIEALEFTTTLCPIGSTALVDEDDGQTGGSYGRMIGKVYCGDVSLNSALLEEGLAYIDETFCSTSEFSSEEWVKKYGCTQTVQKKENMQTSPSQPPASVPPTQTKENNCDPSYPDVCIPPSPPDLDCGEIQYRNFKVLPPDPHRFDGDKDGIGCEE